MRKLNSSDAARAASIIDGVEAAANLGEIRNLKKLQGSPGFFRIRVGQHRLGLVTDKDEVTLVRYLHRKDFYRYFP